MHILQFVRKYDIFQTCGVNVYPKSVKVPDQDADAGQAGGDGIVEMLNMALLDSSGKDIYTTFLSQYWDNKLDGFVVVLDLTNPTSLQNAENWIKLANSCINSKKVDGSSDVLGVLIGNKTDLTERRKISSQTAQEFAQKFSLTYFECSVKENYGLEDPFFFLAHKYTTTSFSEDKENLK